MLINGDDGRGMKRGKGGWEEGEGLTVRLRVPCCSWASRSASMWTIWESWSPLPNWMFCPPAEMSCSWIPSAPWITCTVSNNKQTQYFIHCGGVGFVPGAFIPRGLILEELIPRGIDPRGTDPTLFWSTGHWSLGGLMLKRSYQKVSS